MDEKLSRTRADEARQFERMSWRAAGAQFYPGGAYETLQELSHKGRGPKGYRPSDERLKELICERLTDDPFVDPSNVTVEVANGEVTLGGTVQVRQQKYAIEDIVADVPGVIEIHNRLGVGSEEMDRRTSGL
ncbi:MAG TPA: BON domain-containing protein [Steroidobacteraceae bacterium]